MVISKLERDRHSNEYLIIFRRLYLNQFNRDVRKKRCRDPCLFLLGPGFFLATQNHYHARSIRRVFFFLTNSIIIRLAACHIPPLHITRSAPMSFCQGNRAMVDATKPGKRTVCLRRREALTTIHRTRFDQSPRRVHSRPEIFREKSKKTSYTTSSLHRSGNSNDMRAPFFFFFSPPRVFVHGGDALARGL